MDDVIEVEEKLFVEDEEGGVPKEMIYHTGT